MFSITRWHGVYARLLNYKIIYLYIASIIFFTVTIFVWWYFFYCASLESSLKLERDIARLQMEELSHSKQELMALSESISQLKRSIEINSEEKISCRTIKTCLLDLARAAQDSGMRIVNCSVVSTREDQMCGEFIGSYDQLKIFFETLEHNEQPIDINECTITRNQTHNYSLKAVFAIS